MVRNGIDCIEKYDALFQGKRLGLITSVSGVNRKLKSSIDILAERYEVRALFSPEHGVRGNVDAGGVVAECSGCLYGDSGVQFVQNRFQKTDKRNVGASGQYCI